MCPTTLGQCHTPSHLRSIALAQRNCQIVICINGRSDCCDVVVRDARVLFRILRILRCLIDLAVNRTKTGWIATYTAINNIDVGLPSAGSSTTPIYINSSGVPTACSYSLGAAASKSVTTSVTSGSSALVTSGAVYTAINNKQDKLPAGTSGQVWTAGSDGSGSWQEPAGSGKKLYTGTLASLITMSNSNITINKEFDIEYIIWNYSEKRFYTLRTTVSKSIFSSYRAYFIGEITDGTRVCNIYIHYYDNIINARVGEAVATQLTTESVNEQTSTKNYFRLYV